ncbi:TetR/AcrR family transcriptional regulator [Macrococcus capreoli]
MEKENVQIERTREWVFEALLLLIKEKPYEKITITDITKKAGVARVSFYRNYESKDDIIKKRMEKGLNGIIEIMSKDDKDIPKMIFNYIYDEGQYMNDLSQAGLGYIIVSAFYDFEQRIIEQNKIASETERLLAAYYLGGFFRMILFWIASDEPISASEIARIAEQNLGQVNREEVIRILKKTLEGE